MVGYLMDSSSSGQHWLTPALFRCIKYALRRRRGCARKDTTETVREVFGAVLCKRGFSMWAMQSRRCAHERWRLLRTSVGTVSSGAG